MFRTNYDKLRWANFTAAVFVSRAVVAFANQNENRFSEPI